jgi:hypothetical protein
LKACGVELNSNTTACPRNLLHPRKHARTDALTVLV